MRSDSVVSVPRPGLVGIPAGALAPRRRSGPTASAWAPEADMEHSTHRSQSASGSVDPVCGMTVEPGPETLTLQHGGRLYAFCSRHCLEGFRSDPAADVAAKRETTPEEKPAGRGSQIYTCPMHQELRQSGPGACPKCGMALEPIVPRLAAAQTEYICPMHPQIVRSAPGACPICGMALEPRTVTLADEANPD